MGSHTPKSVAYFPSQRPLRPYSPSPCQTHARKDNENVSPEQTGPDDFPGPQPQAHHHRCDRAKHCAQHDNPRLERRVDVWTPRHGGVYARFQRRHPYWADLTVRFPGNKQKGRDAKRPRDGRTQPGPSFSHIHERMFPSAWFLSPAFDLSLSPTDSSARPSHPHHHSRAIITQACEGHSTNHNGGDDVSNPTDTTWPTQTTQSLTASRYAVTNLLPTPYYSPTLPWARLPPPGYHLAGGLKKDPTRRVHSSP